MLCLVLGGSCLCVHDIFIVDVMQIQEMGQFMVMVG